MFRVIYIRCVFIASVLILVILPLYNLFYVKSTLLNQLQQSKETAAENFVRHMLFTYGDKIPFTAGADIDPYIRTVFEKIRSDFHFWKIECFDPNGIVTYSTDIREVGKRIHAEIFYEKIVNGAVCSFKKFDSVGATMVSERPTAMISTYVPVMTEGVVKGVVEISDDVVSEKQRIDSHIQGTTFQISLFSLFILCIIYFLLRKIRQTMQSHIMIEGELRDSREQYAAVVNGLSVGLAVVNRDLEVLQINKQMQEWFPFIDIRRKTVCYGLFGAATEESKKQCPGSRTLQDGKEHETFTRGNVSGTERQFRVTSTPVVGETGTVESIIMMFEDITDTRLYERRLAQFRNALDRSGDMIFIIDRIKMKCVDVNETATQVLMLTRQQLLDVSLQDIWPYYSEHVFAEIFDSMVDNKEDHSVIESVCRRSDGEEIPTETVFSYIGHEERDAFIAVARDVSERKCVEKVLCDSEFRYRTLFENSNDAIFIRRFGGNVIEVNKVACRLFGHSKDELLHKCLADILQIDSEKYREALRKNANAVYQLPLKVKDGKTIHAELNSQVIQYDDAPAILSVVRDISERKRHEQELEHNLTFLQLVMDTTQSPIYYKDEKGVYRGCNTAFAKMLGKKKSEISGKTVFELMPDRYAKVLFEKDNALMKKKDFQVYETSVPYADGTEHDVLLYKATFSKPSGELGGIVGVILDITERKKIETALQESEERYKQLSSATFEGILVHDKGVVIDGNEQFFSMFGYERNDLLHKQILPLVLTPESLESIKKYLVEKGDRIFNLTGRKRNGMLFPIEIRARSAVMDSRPVRVAVVRDMTTWKDHEDLLRKAKEAAEAASRAKNQFLAHVSHEIRTPMNGIVGFSDLLDQTALSEEQKDYVSTIRESGKSLLCLINDILDIAKIEANQIQVETIQFDIDYLIRSVVKLMSPRVNGGNVRLLCDIASDMPRYFMGDPTRIRQILINLIGNAIKFTERGTVSIAASFAPTNAEDGAKAIVISVKDTGVGIPAEKMHVIFETFSQVDPSITRQYAGSGLGLSIAKSLVERMGGTITARSEVGRGSEFIVVLPLSVAEHDEQIAPVGIDAISGKSVAFIIREDSMNTCLADWSRSLGLRLIYQAKSSADGVSWLLSAQEAPDIVIIDIMMPLMSGYRCAEELRRHERFSKVKMIAVVAEGSPGMAHDAQESGFNAYIAQPMVQDDFVEIVKMVFGDYAASRQIVTRHLAQEGRLKDPRILVAEDNAVNLKLIRLILDQFGCVVDVANDGMQVIEKVKSNPYDLILMDIQMPRMSGIETTRVIRQECQLKIPIIALTAAAMEDDKRCALESGMDDYVAKPIDIQKLKTVLTKWVRC